MPKLEAIPSFGRSGSRRARAVRVSSSLAEINVVPLIDVMLVLLVIFMVTAPMMQQGFPVNLPQSRRSVPLDVRPVVVSVPMSFRTDSKVRLGTEPVSLALLPARVKQALTGRLTQDVTLRADGDIVVSEMMLVWDALRAGGVSSVAIQTQPARAQLP
jgi:biopolymer transport protein ExbD